MSPRRLATAFCQGTAAPRRRWGVRSAVRVLAAVLVAAACAGGARAQEPGRMTIRSLPQSLAGTWLFRTGASGRAGGAWRPVEVPGPWEASAAPGYDGHAWYRLQVYVPEELAERVLGIAFSRIRDADELFLNGRLVGKTADFPPRFAKGTFYRRVYPLPSALTKPGAWNELTLHVYNHARDGGITGQAPLIAPYRLLLDRAALDSYVLIGFVVFFLMVAANHFFLFGHRPKTRANLTFALFSLAVALYLLTFSPLVAGHLVGFNLLFRVNVVLFPLVMALFLAFIVAFFGTPAPRAVRVLLGFLGLTAAAAAVWPDITALYACVTAAELAAIPAAGAVLWMLVRAVLHKAPYARAVGAVGVLTVATALYDIANDVNLVSPPSLNVAGLLFPFGFIPFYVVMGLILGHRYATYYDRSITDGLTGLMQRNHFLERLGREMERAGRGTGCLVVGMIDLDEFKQINDRVSHRAGDVVLAEVARRIKDCLRGFDLVGRYGGDEICVAMAVGDPDEARSMLERIRWGVAGLVCRADGRELYVTVSVGAVVCNRPQETHTDEVVAAADRALYRAKTAGGNRVELARWNASGTADVISSRG